MNDLPILQKTYDLIKWYVPILNRLPRDHKFQLGDRMINSLYELLESFVTVRYQRQKIGTTSGDQFQIRSLAISDAIIV